MATITTIHFNGGSDPITVEGDYHDAKLALASLRPTHEFVRVVGDNRSRVTVLTASIAYIEETEVVEPFAMAV